MGLSQRRFQNGGSVLTRICQKTRMDSRHVQLLFVAEKVSVFIAQRKPLFCLGAVSKSSLQILRRPLFDGNMNIDSMSRCRRGLDVRRFIIPGKKKFLVAFVDLGLTERIAGVYPEIPPYQLFVDFTITFDIECTNIENRTFYNIEMNLNSIGRYESQLS